MVLAAVVVLILWAAAPRESAEDAAQEYLDTIAAGDIARANELVPAVPELGHPATADGRTPAAIAGWTPISQQQVAGSTESVDGMLVEISYVVGDSTHSASLTVVPEEDTGLFAEGWQVQTPLSLSVSVDSTSAGLPVTLGELEIAAGRDAKVTLYPGSYQVAFAGGDFLAGDEYTLDVVPTSDDEVTRIEVLPEPTGALTDELTEYVNDALENCTIRDESYVSQCQLRANRDGDGIALEPVTWTVLAEPTTTENSSTELIELSTTLQAEYEVAEEPDGPRTPVTEEIEVRTELMVRFESADSYQIMDVHWRTMPSDS